MSKELVLQITWIYLRKRLLIWIFNKYHNITKKAIRHISREMIDLNHTGLNQKEVMAYELYRH